MAHRFSLGTLMLAFCLGFVLAGSAEAQDISGAWNFQADVPATCTWTGPATFTQTAGALTGAGNLTLSVGTNPPCPSPLVGTVAGTIAGTTVNFGLTTPGGTINFTGTTDVAGNSMSGTWALGQVLAGTWSATRAPVMPTLPEWGMLALVAALLAGGAYLLQRWRGSLFRVG